MSWAIKYKFNLTQYGYVTIETNNKIYLTNQFKLYSFMLYISNSSAVRDSIIIDGNYFIMNAEWPQLFWINPNNLDSWIQVGIRYSDLTHLVIYSNGTLADITDVYVSVYGINYLSSISHG